MRYIVDTNVLSNMTRPQPDKGVAKWFAETNDSDMFISVMSIGELVYGAEKLPEGAKKAKLLTWLREVIYEGFADRIVDIDASVMTAWGRMMSKLSRSLPIQDTLIAATALVHDMTIVTHNVKDFQDIDGLEILDP